MKRSPKWHELPMDPDRRAVETVLKNEARAWRNRFKEAKKFGGIYVDLKELKVICFRAARAFDAALEELRNAACEKK